MRAVLHILTKPDDRLAQDMIARQQSSGENQIVVVDLTEPAPDYKDLLAKIFAADSVQTW